MLPPTTLPSQKVAAKAWRCHRDVPAQTNRDRDKMLPTKKSLRQRSPQRLDAATERHCNRQTHGQDKTLPPKTLLRQNFPTRLDVAERQRSDRHPDRDEMLPPKTAPPKTAPTQKVTTEAIHHCHRRCHNQDQRCRCDEPLPSKTFRSLPSQDAAADSVAIETNAVAAMRRGNRRCHRDKIRHRGTTLAQKTFPP